MADRPRPSNAFSLGRLLVADPLSPRPMPVVLASWLTMVWSGFALISSALCLVASLLVSDLLRDLPFLAPLADLALWTFATTLLLSGIALQLGSLVWRRSAPARWLLVVVAAPVGLLCPFAGPRPGAFFGVPIAVTVLCLLLPSTSGWFEARRTADQPRRRAAAIARPTGVVAGCAAALLSHGIGIVTLALALVTLAGTDLGDHELSEYIDPIAAQTWGLALLLVFAVVHLAVVLAALLALGGSSAARLVVSVASGISVLVNGGSVLIDGSEAGALLGAAPATLSLVALLLLATPRANAWFRASGAVDAHEEAPEPTVGVGVPE